jgi:dCTP deaminase
VTSSSTKERVEVPPDLIAHVQGRSSMGRLAVVVHATAGVVDPGYAGQITLELSNLGTAPVALTPGMRISQLIFTRLTSPADRPYGAERGSKYQGQEGPQASRIQSDDEFHGDQAGAGDTP